MELELNKPHVHARFSAEWILEPTYHFTAESHDPLHSPETSDSKAYILREMLVSQFRDFIYMGRGHRLCLGEPTKRAARRTV
jgi:hypothetical protein